MYRGTAPGTTGIGNSTGQVSVLNGFRIGLVFRCWKQSSARSNPVAETIESIYCRKRVKIMMYSLENNSKILITKVQVLYNQRKTLPQHLQNQTKCSTAQCTKRCLTLSETITFPSNATILPEPRESSSSCHYSHPQCLVT